MVAGGENTSGDSDLLLGYCQVEPALSAPCGSPIFLWDPFSAIRGFRQSDKCHEKNLGYLQL